MKKIKFITTAFACAFALLTGSALADYTLPADATGKVISFNVAQMGANGQPAAGEIPTTAQTTLVGEIPQDAWSQGTSSAWLNQSNFSSFKVYDLKNPTVDPVAITTMTASWNSPSTTNYGRGGADNVTEPDAAYYYLDCWLAMKNTAASSNPSLSINNIPYEKYDLILYFNGSTNNNRQKNYSFSLNSTNYSVDENGAPVSGSTAEWGARNQTTAVLGTNAVKFENLIIPSVSIVYTGAGGGIAAFQIVDRTPAAKEVMVAGTEVAVSAINQAVIAAGGSVDDIYEITLSEATSLAFDTTLAFAKAKLVSTGALTLVSRKSIADFGKFDFTRVAGGAKYGWCDYPGAKLLAINFNANGDRIEAADADSAAIGVSMKGAAWLNVTDASQATAQDFPVYDTATKSATGEKAKVTWSGSVNYQKDNSVAKFLRGYLDDGAPGATVNVADIPFEYYDVIVYSHGDGGEGTKNRAFTVNGTTYSCGDDGIGFVKSESWGNSATTEPTLGKNAMVVKSQSGNLTIVGNGSNGGRGPLNAVVIVEVAPTVKDVDCGASYVFGDTDNAYDEDVVNLNFADEGGTLTLSKLPSRSFNIASKGMIEVVFSGDVSFSTDIFSKLNIARVDGGLRFTFTKDTFPTTVPDKGVIYRLKDTATLDTIPFAGTAFAGTVELDCPVDYVEADHGDAMLGIAGNHNYIFDDGFILTANRLQIGNNNSAVQNFVQNGGTITLSKEYDGYDTTSEMPLLFAHWPSTCTYDLVGGSITAENGNVMFGRDGTIAMTVGGGVNAATFKVRGLFRDVRENACSLTILENGRVEIGEGGVDFQANKTIALAGGTLAAYASTTISMTEDFVVSDESKLEVAEGEMLTFDALVTGDGALIVTGDVVFASVPLCTVVIQGDSPFRLAENIADDGRAVFTLAAGSQISSVVIMGVDGEEKEATVTKAGNTYTATYEPSVTGKVALFDFPFNGDLVSVGKNTSTLGKDQGPNFNEENTAVRADTRPWLGYTLPVPFTAAIYCVLPTKASTVLISFGNASKNIFLATGASENEVELNYYNGKVTTLTKMTVTSATTVPHLYAFILSEDRTTADVYVDGVLNISYTLPDGATFEINTGLQVGGWYQGTVSGYARPDNANDGGFIEELLVYDAPLGPTAMKVLSGLFPYVSQNGLFRRTFAGAENWVLEGAWQEYDKQGPKGDPVSAPRENATVEITASADSVVTINTDATLNYEAVSFAGEGAFSFVPSAAGGKVVNLGATVVGCPVTIAYGAMEVPGALDTSAGETLTFDYSAYPIDTVYGEKTIELTGLTSASAPIACTLPQNLYGRTMVAGFDSSTKKFALVIGADRDPMRVYLKAGTTEITDSTVFVDEDGNEVERLCADDAIVITNEITGISLASGLRLPIASLIVGEGGVFKIATASFTAKLIVEEGGVLDANGVQDFLAPIELAGGVFVNSGAAIDTGKKQFATISLSADSTIAETNMFNSIANAFGAHTVDLGGYTLTKTGPAPFTAINTTFTSGTIAVEEGEFVFNGYTVGPDTTLTIDVAEGATVRFTNAANKGITKNGTINITGAGTIIYDAVVPNFNGKDGWTGTVWIKNQTIQPLNITGYANDDSLVKLTGITGYLQANTVQNAALDLADENNTLALVISNSSSGNVYKFPKSLTGTGTFKFATVAGSPCAAAFANVEGFTGTLSSTDVNETTARPIYVGPVDSATAGTGSLITVADGMTIGCTLEAANITIGRNVTIKGAIGDIVAWGLTSAPTLPDKVKLVGADGRETIGRLVYNSDNGTLTIASGLGFLMFLK